MKYFFASASENRFIHRSRVSNSNPFWSYTSALCLTSLLNTADFFKSTPSTIIDTALFCPEMAVNLCDYNSNIKWQNGSKTSLLELMWCAYAKGGALKFMREMLADWLQNILTWLESLKIYEHTQAYDEGPQAPLGHGGSEASQSITDIWLMSSWSRSNNGAESWEKKLRQ